jgi:hypothetical protein
MAFGSVIGVAGKVNTNRVPSVYDVSIPMVPP